MLFSSHEFIFVFLPAALLVFHLSRAVLGGCFSLVAIVSVSLFFYGWWTPPYLFLLIGSILANFAFVRLLEKHPNSTILMGGVAVNLTVLGYFKYWNFFLENISFVTGNTWSLGPIFIPLAISFFTFQQIALLIDVREGRAKVRDLLSYSVFVALFPQLIAGPIILYREINDQFAKIRSGEGVGLAMLGVGLYLFALGLFKKVALADSIAPYADAAFNMAERLTFLEAWAGAFAYSLQLYFDFSGYSDMAVGLGLMLGLTLPINFNIPFRSTYMIEFWKRWHITMTRFFIMYLYSPIALSISRWSMGRSFTGITAFVFTVGMPIGITFLLSGLWHGAAWTFVAFGAVNALGLIVNHAWKEAKCPRLPSLLGWVFTMMVVVISLVYFRAENLADAHKMLAIMASPQNIVLPSWLAELAVKLDLPWHTLTLFSSGSYTLRMTLWLIILFALSILMQNPAKSPKQVAPSWRNAYLTASYLLLSFGLLDRPQAFVYFQF